MAKIMKFVYTMIPFLSIFIITLQVNGVVVCEIDADCPQICMPPYEVRCVNHRCRWVNTDDSLFLTQEFTRSKQYIIS